MTGKQHSGRTRSRATRRGFLQAGALAMGGLNLSDVMRLQAGSSPGSGRPKSAIMIFLSGGPSHLDMYDMKPDSPVGIRGKYDPGATNVSGLHLSDQLPRLSTCADMWLPGIPGNHQSKPANGTPRAPVHQCSTKEPITDAKHQTA